MSPHTTMLKRAGAVLAVTAALAGPAASRAAAQSAAPAAPQSPTPGPETTASSGSSPDLFAPSRSNLLGDAFGVRTTLGNYGISLGLTNSSEVFGNVSGGIRRGATLFNLTQAGIGLDTQKAFGWGGGTFNLSAFWIAGPNFSARYTGALQTASGIVAEPTVRLWEVWYQQAFLDGRADVKLGQQSLDQEFMVSAGSGLFLNTMMGWPLMPSVNLYAGGPAYPLSSLGVRFRGKPADGVTVLAGVFQDNPPGGPFDDDSQLRGSTRWGGNFNLRTGALFISELQYELNQPAEGQLDTAETKRGLPGTYKIGGWFDTGPFYDQALGSDGLSLADPAGNGQPRKIAHNWSLYAVADQTIWRPDPEGPFAVGVFARPMIGPSTQNLINFSVNGGVTLKGAVPGRDDDTFGVGMGYGHVSPRATSFDVATRTAAPDVYTPLRRSETFIEVTYQAQIAPWWTVQPDFQYVWHPGGSVVSPGNPNRRLPNATILGLRTSITF